MARLSLEPSAAGQDWRIHFSVYIYTYVHMQGCYIQKTQDLLRGGMERGGGYALTCRKLIHLPRSADLARGDFEIWRERSVCREVSVSVGQEITERARNFGESRLWDTLVREISPDRYRYDEPKIDILSSCQLVSTPVNFISIIDRCRTPMRSRRSLINSVSPIRGASQRHLDLLAHAEDTFHALNRGTREKHSRSRPA